MFDFLNKNKPYNVFPFPKPVETPGNENEMDDCCYTVGNDGNNNVVLMLHSQHGSITSLTMNEPAVRHMISLLEAVIIKE